MPDLTHSLQGRDLGFLRIIASLWGIDLNAPDARTALPALVNAMLDPALACEVVDALPVEAHQALAVLIQSEGRLPWAPFTRRFGGVREMGPGRRDRERPYLSPASPVETLWYRALIARGFLSGEPEPQEFAYIPDDLLERLPALAGEAKAPLGRPATPYESAAPIFISDRILDQATTLLAALRLGMEPAALSVPEGGMPTSILQNLLASAGLLDAQGLPLPEPTRDFLEAARNASLAYLYRAWADSETFNELHQLPGLKCEGEWINQPRQTRQTILSFLESIPPNTWWSIAGFVSALREMQPDFQRPAGDYDSWYIRREGSDEYLRGFAHWDEVDGALVRYLLTGPLHWLGMLDLAAPTPEAAPAAFRFSPWASALLSGALPSGFPAEDGSIQVVSDGRIRLPVNVPRATRYQIARFCQWDGESPDDYRYRITPASLERAKSQGLKLTHLLSLFKKQFTQPPPSLVQALERWEQNGTQARLADVTILRLATPEMLTALRKSKAARFLGDPLGPTAVIVHPGAREKVIRTLVEMGYLTDAEIDPASGV